MNESYSFGPFQLIPRTRALYRNGSEVHLGSRAFDVLVGLIERDGGVLTPREMMAIAWPGLCVSEANVRVQIANLRKALGCGRDGQRYIASVTGRGYCFVGSIEQVAGRRDEAASYPLMRVIG
ncbi:winged helix-turn-helix domain-containing protein [Luteibacter yeojuensis]|jgi:DNA-binding winged helix-turn-helix (wHTH) protein